MYPDITKYREEYVLPIAQSQGYLHLGLGCRLHTDSPDKDIRTLSNATIQFWSILTLLAVNELHHCIDSDGMSDRVLVNATIYDSIYGLVRADEESIEWLNTNIVPIMEKDFMINQIVHNEATLEIGPNWSDLTTVPKNATLAQIKEIIDES